MYKRLAILGAVAAAVLVVSGCAVYPGYGYYDGYYYDNDYYYQGYYYGPDIFWYIPGYFHYYPDYWHYNGKHRRPPGHWKDGNRRNGKGFGDFIKRPPPPGIGTEKPNYNNGGGRYQSGSRGKGDKGFNHYRKKPKGNDGDEKWEGGFNRMPPGGRIRYGVDH